MRIARRRGADHAAPGSRYALAAPLPQAGEVTWPAAALCARPHAPMPPRPALPGQCRPPPLHIPRKHQSGPRFRARTRQSSGTSSAGFMSGVNDIRAGFLDYFAKAGHEIVPSSPLVPRNDPTLMFTNAGMVQFKNVFTGLEKRPYQRATTSQKCVRAGGKHNDLDNVGYTARHHTFFEMLGNFSFGDYFKDRAIELAWNLVTKEFGLPKDKLTATVYVDDDQAFDLWKKIAGLPDSRIIRIAGSDNFWQMGDTGPCGPCSEIFYDHGDKIPGGPPGSPTPTATASSRSGISCSCSSSSMPGGARIDLPRPSIDTGMGLERIAAVLQGTHDNYSIDLFRALIGAIAELTKVSPDGRAEGLASRHRRSSARVGVPDRRRRAAVERRPRLRAPPHHAPRHAPRRAARRARAADVEARAGAGPRDGPGLSGAGPRRGADHRDAEARRDALSQDAGARPVDPRRRDQDAQARRQPQGRDRVHALRHLRLSARSHPGRAARPRHRRRSRRLQRGDGAAEGQGARLVGGLGRRRSVDRVVSDPREARRDRVPRLRDRDRRGRRHRARSRRQGGRRAEGRRDRRRDRQPDAVLRRVRRPGRRHRRDDGRRRALRGERHAEGGRRPVRASRQGRAGHAQGRARRWRSTSITRAAARSGATIRRRICCTRRCARCSAITSRRRARWSRPTGCASISRIRSRSPRKSSSASRTWRTITSCRTRR